VLLLKVQHTPHFRASTAFDYYSEGAAQFLGFPDMKF
jgi:hypothetical protein